MATHDLSLFVSHVLRIMMQRARYHLHHFFIGVKVLQNNVGMGKRKDSENLVSECLTDRFDPFKIQYRDFEFINSSKQSFGLRP